MMSPTICVVEGLEEHNEEYTPDSWERLIKLIIRKAAAHNKGWRWGKVKSCHLFQVGDVKGGNWRCCLAGWLPGQYVTLEA